MQADILSVIRRRIAQPRRTPIRTWSYFTAAIRNPDARPPRPAERADGAEKHDANPAVERPDPMLGCLALSINSGRDVPQRAITHTQRDELLRREWVTAARLRTLGTW